jgi:hypothetical protein
MTVPENLGENLGTFTSLSVNAFNAFCQRLLPVDADTTQRSKRAFGQS